LIRSKNDRGKWILPNLKSSMRRYGNVLLKTTKNDRIVLVRLARRIYSPRGLPPLQVDIAALDTSYNIMYTIMIILLKRTYIFIFKTFLHFLCTNGPHVFFKSQTLDHICRNNIILYYASNGCVFIFSETFFVPHLLISFHVYIVVYQSTDFVKRNYSNRNLQNSSSAVATDVPN